MRVFICFEGLCEPFDISPDQTVQAMKQMVKKNFLIQLPDDKHVWHFLELSYCGAALQDSWALCDVGITGGSTIRCLIKSEQRPVMHVFNAVTGETLPITGSEALLHMSITRLKTVVSMQSCLPVSTFRLTTSSGVQLYDCNQLQDYAIEVGTTLRLDAWDGWVEFLQGCLLGHRLTVQSHLSLEKTVMRFQLRVALYIAASLGHLDLADWLMKKGVHAEEPVGVHPYRQWCYRAAHQDSGKCPIHVAAERNQLLILKLFVTRNVLTLACRDPGGHGPLKIAIQHGYRECVQYLANKLCSVISLPNMSLPMRIYIQIKRWVSLGQKRVASNQCHCSSASFQARVLLIDGFSQSKMSSKSIKDKTEPRGGVTDKALHSLPAIGYLPQLSLLSMNPGGFRDIQKHQKKDAKHKKEIRLDKMKEGDKRCKFTLPPIDAGSPPRPLFVGALSKSYNTENASLESSHHYSQATRQNAIYCLSIARSNVLPFFLQIYSLIVLNKVYLHREILVKTAEHCAYPDPQACPLHGLMFTDPIKKDKRHPDLSPINQSARDSPLSCLTRCGR